MNIYPAVVPELSILEPRVFDDVRGRFFPSMSGLTFRPATKLSGVFVGDSHSRSAKDVLRGLHSQSGQTQGTLMRALEGSVFDVVVDFRFGLPTFRCWVGFDVERYRLCIQWPLAGQSQLSAIGSPAKALAPTNLFE